MAGSTLRFHFRGKGGKEHEGELQDRRVARIVRRCQELPGHELFEYVDPQRQRHDVGSGDVNDYLREITGQVFTAKDFRTWNGTLLAIRALREIGPGDSPAQLKKNIVQAIDAVTEQLGNTRAVCRKYYVHPAVCEAYTDGSLFLQCVVPETGETGEDLSMEEAAVLSFLRQRLASESRHPTEAVRGASSAALPEPVVDGSLQSRARPARASEEDRGASKTAAAVA